MVILISLLRFCTLYCFALSIVVALQTIAIAINTKSEKERQIIAIEIANKKKSKVNIQKKAKKVKSDNFRVSYKEKSNIAFAIWN